MISYKCRPSKWVWGLIPLALPFLGAWFLNSPIMVNKLAQSALESLKTGGFAELNVTMDGRDAVLGGQAQSQDAIDKAVQSVVGQYGVRRVDYSDVKIIAPVVLDVPTVVPGTGNDSQPVLTGTWPEGSATTLAVKVGDKSYVLGKDAELSSDGKGNWKLKPSSPLADGVHDVAVSITDGKKAAAIDASKDEVVIDTTPPGAPTIATKLVTKLTRPTVKGTWAGKEAKSLAVSLAGQQYTLGKDKALVADDKGNWTLTPAKDLADGVYDVTVKTADELGNVSTSTGTGALTVDTTAPATGSVMVSQGSDPKPEINGTWSNVAGNTLTVDVDGNSYSLGKDKALSTDGNGNWTLKLAKPLAAGKHAVKVTSADALGNENSMTSPGVIVVDNVAPKAPVVTSAVNATTAPIFKGTWAEKVGNTLKVVVAGKIFSLGRDKQLTSDGKGNWTLALKEPLSDGKYPILAESSDAFGNLARTEKPAIVAVDTTKPDQPTISSLASRSQTPAIAGTWPENAQNGLSVAVDGKSYELGKDKQLTSDGKGNWSLTPSGKLADGSYDVVATVTDQAGNKAVAASPKAVMIDSTAPSAATVTKVISKYDTPTIGGTWDAGDSAALTVSVAGKTYSSVNDGEIAINANNWSLKPASPLKDGFYDVVTEVVDKAGNTNSATAEKAIIVDTTAPQAPTVTTALTRNRTPTITGTWDSSDAVKLSVSIAGQSFSNANQGEIEINGDHWTITPRSPIADGTYDVSVSTADKVGNGAKDVGSGELTIDGTSPATPSVRPVFGTNQRPPVGGAWDEDGQNSLSVSLDGKAYSLTKSGPLTSDGKGNWKLALQQNLKPGSYDVKVKVADKLGNQSNDVSNGEIWVKPVPKPVVVVVPPKKAEPEPAPMPVNTCQKDFTVTLAGQSIGFKTNKTEINQASQELINRLAEIAKACPDAKIEVSGHTDSRGSASYNQSLSEGRASAVVDGLVSRGVAKNRLRAVGYGESRPIADNKTKQGLAKNRRIEFKVEQ